MTKPITIVEPPEGAFALNLQEVWAYRDLLMLMAWRDISARFRQSVIGYGWAILRPILSTAIFTLVFSYILRTKTEVPYPIFAFAGLMPWLYFSSTLAGVTTSIVGGASLMTKVYFPRLVLPLAKVAVGLVELGLQFIVFAGLMVIYQYAPGWQILVLPIFVAITVVTALAFGIWLTALNVKYRDVGMAVPFVIQTWMYLCPIVYPLEQVPERFRAIYAINPMVGVIEGFRWALLGTAAPDWTMVGVSMIVMLLVLVSGLAYFRRVETTFADII